MLMIIMDTYKKLDNGLELSLGYLKDLKNTCIYHYTRVFFTKKSGEVTVGGRIMLIFCE